MHRLDVGSGQPRPDPAGQGNDFNDGLHIRLGIAGVRIIFALAYLCEVLILSSKKFPGIPKHLQYFGGCIILHMLFPLSPILLESIFATISLKSLTLVACMYSISIGLSSRNFLSFALSLMIGFYLAVVFGAISANPNLSNPLFSYSWLLIIIAFGIHLPERYVIHVLERAPYPLFIKGESDD